MQVESHASATRFSIAPWKLGVLSGLSALLDVFLAERFSVHDEAGSCMACLRSSTFETASQSPSLVRQTIGYGYCMLFSSDSDCP